MKLNLFNGGLNLREAPNLLKVNESIVCENVDVSGGSLKSLRGDKDLNAEGANSIYKFKNVWIRSNAKRHYAEFNQKLFFTDSADSPKWSEDGVNFYNLGLEAPSSPPFVSGYSSGNLTNFEIFKESITVSADSDLVWNKEYKTPSASAVFLRMTVGQIAVIQAYNRIPFGFRTFEKGEYSGEIEISSKDKPVKGLVKFKDVNWWRITGASYWIDDDSVALVALVGSNFKQEVGLRLSFNKGPKTQMKNEGPAVNTWAELKQGFIFSNTATNTSDTEDFSEIKEAKYVAVWTGSDDRVSVETFSVNFSEVSLGNVIFGLKILKVEGQTLKLYRDGKKVNLSEDDEAYYDYRKPTDEGLEEIESFLKSVNYVYTYYNSKIGLESAPSEAGGTLAVGDMNYVSIKVEASKDPQVDKIRIYRVGGGLGYYSLVAELDNLDTSFDDYKSNVEVSSALLESFSYQPPAKGLAFLRSWNSMLFGAFGNKLYYSRVGNPFFWDAFDFITFDDEITGLGTHPNYMVVFTKNKTYTVVGNSPKTLSRYILSDSIGCVDHNTIQSNTDSIIWLASDGLYTIQGSRAWNLSWPKLGDFDFDVPLDSIFFRDKYILSFNTFTLVLDFNLGGIFSFLGRIYRSFYADGSALFASTEDLKLIQMFQGELLEFKYKTPEFAEGSLSELKTFNSIYTYAEGEVSLSVLIDGKVVVETKLEEGAGVLEVPQDSIRGYKLQLSLQGLGEVREIEYKAEGRLNGR